MSGHGLCTAAAVIGGRAIAGRVSLRVGKLTKQFSLKPKLHIRGVFSLTNEILVTLGGGFAFLVFGIIYLVEAMYIT